MKTLARTELTQQRGGAGTTTVTSSVVTGQITVRVRKCSIVRWRCKPGMMPTMPSPPLHGCMKPPMPMMTA